MWSLRRDAVRVSVDDDDFEEASPMEKKRGLRLGLLCALGSALLFVLVATARKLHHRATPVVKDPVAAAAIPLVTKAASTARVPRVRLIYKHVAKTGGQAVVSYLHAEYRALMADGTITIRSEREPVTLADAALAFIISSVRNPCAFYVSLWAFGIEGKGRYRQSFVAEHRNDSVLSNVFSTTPADHRAMAAFTYASQGEFSRRYREYVPNLTAVDCWVHTETMDLDVGRCLHRFAAEAGPPMQHRLAERRGPGKALADYNVHGTRHGPCDEYYDDAPSLRAMVTRGDAHVLDHFPEYGHRCCSRPTERDDHASLVSTASSPTSSAAPVNHTQAGRAQAGRAPPRGESPAALAAGARPWHSNGGEGSSSVESLSSSKGSGGSGGGQRQHPPPHPAAATNAAPGHMLASLMSDPHFARREGGSGSSEDIGRLAWQRDKARPVVERLGWTVHDRAAAHYNCEWLGSDELGSFHALQDVVHKRAYTSVHDVEQLARTWYVPLGLYGLMAALEEGASRHHQAVLHEGKHRVGVVATELAQSRRNRCREGVSAPLAAATVDATNMSSGLSLCALYPISFDGYRKHALRARTRGRIRGVAPCSANQVPIARSLARHRAWSTHRHVARTRGEDHRRAHGRGVLGVGVVERRVQPRERRAARGARRAGPQVVRVVCPRHRAHDGHKREHLPSPRRLLHGRRGGHGHSRGDACSGAGAPVVEVVPLCTDARGGLPGGGGRMDGGHDASLSCAAVC